MEPRVQELTKRYLQQYQNESLFELSGTQLFLKEVHHNNGFGYEDIDYDQDVVLEQLLPKRDNLFDYNE
jgi:trans-2-enoyl-CoA reductase